MRTVLLRRGELNAGPAGQVVLSAHSLARPATPHRGAGSPVVVAGSGSPVVVLVSEVVVCARASVVWAEGSPVEEPRSGARSSEDADWHARRRAARPEERRMQRL